MAPTQRDAAERDDDRARHVRLHARRGNGALRRHGPIAVDDVHADRCGQLHGGDQDGRDHGDEGDDRHHLGDTRDIVYGTALSATQLNATTTVPGTFVYTPPATTVLPAGAAQSLSVTFTPADTANYTTATKTVAITVTKATPVITWARPRTSPTAPPSARRS